jgi:hypothetical protein
VGAALAGERGLLEGAADAEGLVVLVAALAKQLVGRARELACLQPFLQPGLGVLADLVQRRQRIQQRFVPAQHEVAAGVEAGIEVAGGDHRFQRIGQDRVAAVAAGLHLAGTEREPFAHFKAARERCQRGFAYQFGAGPGHRAFVGLRPAQVQLLGDDQVEQRVTEELEALVVRAAGAAVAECLPQQRRVGEAMAAERVAGRGQSAPLLVSASDVENLPTTSRLAISGLRTS